MICSSVKGWNVFRAVYETASRQPANMFRAGKQPHIKNSKKSENVKRFGRENTA